MVWQIFDKAGKPKGKQGRADAIAAWSFGVAYARPDGGFGIIY